MTDTRAKQPVWCVALWEISPDALESVLGIRLGREADELDAYWFADFVDEQVGRVLLIRRDNPPGAPGFEVFVPEDLGRDDALRLLEERFGMADDHLIWVTPMERHLPPGDPRLPSYDQMEQLFDEEVARRSARRALARRTLVS